jgi:putrescine aminotransferase
VNTSENQLSFDESVVADYENYVNPGLAAVMKFIGLDSVEMEANGCIVTDSRGRTFLDCLGGYGTMSVGYAHPHVVAAVQEQVAKQAFSCRILFNEHTAKLARKLAEISPGDLQYSFFCNSGTEAAEAALKIARKATGRAKLVSTIGAFHGKTMGALAVSGREKYKTPFAPMVPECVQIPFNDIAALSEIDENTAAFFVEPIQGENGILEASDEYLQAARKACDAAGALLVFDEIQTGLGRTGKMWGSENSGVFPDLMLLAKALSGACIPIGACIGTPKTWEIFAENPLIHSSTFGGNPLACRAALAAIEVIESENLVERSHAQGEKLKAALLAAQREYSDLIKEVRGRGLMLGVEFSHDDIAGLVIAGMAARGVLAAYTLNNATVIRFEPPLIISDAQIEQAATAFSESLAQARELLEDIEMDEE